MNNEERMAAQLAELRIQDINKQMDAITKLARAYADATPEQRANVDASEIQAQIERYENLKAERTNLYAEQEVRAQKELEAQRRAEQVAAQRAAQGTGRRVVRRNNDVPTGTPTSDPTGTLTDEQYAEWLAELEREAYLQNPHPIFNNGDGTYDYSDGTKRYADGTIVRGESNNIEVRTAPSGAPYYYDKTTGNQAQQIGTDKNGNPLVVDSQGGVATMYPIDNAIHNTMVANAYASDAARGYNNALVNQSIVQGQTRLGAMAAPALIYGGLNYVAPYLNGALTNGARTVFTSGRGMSEPMTQAFRNTATRDYANGFARTFASDSPAYIRNGISTSVNPNNAGVLVQESVTPNYSNWVNNLTNTYNRVVNANRLSKAMNPVSEGSIIHPTTTTSAQGSIPKVITSWGDLSRIRGY